MKGLTKYIKLLLALGMVACQNDGAPKSDLQKPTAILEVNRINLVIDTSLWQDELGDSIRNYFTQAYPIMPHPEPVFDVRQFSYRELVAKRFLKEFRHYIIIPDLQDTMSTTTKMVTEDVGEETILTALSSDEPTLKIGRNKWAREQIIIYVLAKSTDIIKEDMDDLYSKIAPVIWKNDSPYIDKSAYALGENRGGTVHLKEKYDLDLSVPKEYQLVMEDGDYSWFRKDTKTGIYGLQFYRKSYENEEELSVNALKALRNQLGAYVGSRNDSSYMVINDIDLPFVSVTKEIDGQYGRVLHGVWEMEHDFMGGPFVSYLVQYPDKKSLLFVDAFIYDPGKDKRDEMQRQISVIEGMKFQ